MISLLTFLTMLFQKTIIQEAKFLRGAKNYGN